MHTARILVLHFVLALSALGAEPEKRFAITGYGAVADGEKVQTAAIQKAIEAAATAGGGTVVIPRGTFRSGAIFLKPGVHLHLDEGAVLKGSDDIADYPIQPTRIEGRTNDWAVALVNATGTDGLRISGTGTIDGSGMKFWNAFWDRRKENPKCTNLEVVRPRMMHIRDAKNVRVSGIQMRDSGFWTLHLFQCDGVLVEGIRIVNPQAPVRAPSTDGIDIDSCRNVTVRGCYLVESGRAAPKTRAVTINAGTSSGSLTGVQFSPTPGSVYIPKASRFQISWPTGGSAPPPTFEVRLWRYKEARNSLSREVTEQALADPARDGNSFAWTLRRRDGADLDPGGVYYLELRAPGETDVRAAYIVSAEL